MLRKRVAYVLIMIFTVAVSFIAGYFTTLRYAKNNIKDSTPQIQSNNNNVEAAAKIPVSDVIKESTSIIKKDRYLKGVEFVKESVEKPSAEILGMDVNSAEQFFKGMGYRIIKFTPSEVIVSRDVLDSWPLNCYVVKEDNGFVAIFKVENDGSLSLLERTEIEVEKLPLQEREDVIKGKVFETREKAENLIEEDYSS